MANFLGWIKNAIVGMKDEIGFEIVKTGLKEIFTMVMGKAKKEVASAIGSTTDEAKKSFDEDGEYLKSILNENLGKRDANRALDFAQELREKKPELAVAYVLALAKLAKQFENGMRGSGSASIAKLVQLLLQRKTFKERVAFIKGWGIEALISPPKKGLSEVLDEYLPVILDNLGKISKSAKKGTRKLQRQLEKDPYRGFWTESLGFNPIPRKFRRRVS